MNVKKLFSIRPKAETVEELEAALARARTAGEAARARVDELQRRRAATLLDGEETQVLTAERDLADARAEAERAETIIPALEERVETMKRDQVAAAVRSAIDIANAKSEAAKEAMLNIYPDLARAIVRDVIAREVAAIDARAAAMQALREARDRGLSAEAIASMPALSAAPVEQLYAAGGGSMYRMVALADEIKLPSVAGRGGIFDGAVPFWPAPRA